MVITLNVEVVNILTCTSCYFTSYISACHIIGNYLLNFYPLLRVLLFTESLYTLQDNIAICSRLRSHFVSGLLYSGAAVICIVYFSCYTCMWGHTCVDFCCCLHHTSSLSEEPVNRAMWILRFHTCAMNVRELQSHGNLHTERT